MPLENFYTSGDLSSKLKVPSHKVLYLLRTMKIQPRGRVGAYRIYDDATLKKLREELRVIQAAKDAGTRADVYRAGG